MYVCVGEVGERGGGEGGEYAYTNGVVTVVSKLW